MLFKKFRRVFFCVCKLVVLLVLIVKPPSLSNCVQALPLEQTLLRLEDNFDGWGGWSHCIVLGASKINAVLWVCAKCLECKYNLPSNTSDFCTQCLFRV